MSLLSTNGLCLHPPPPFTAAPGRLTYSRDFLLELRDLHVESANTLPCTNTIPLEILRLQKLKRSRWRRGSGGRIRNRVKRRGTRIPLPAIILSNVRSLRNKTEELSTLIRSDLDYQQASIFCFTETWLSKDVDFQLEGF